MKTSVPTPKFLNTLSLVVIGMLLSFSLKAQTYTSVKNGDWDNASTWQGGIMPPVNGNITASMVINVKHKVKYTNASINNYGTINIMNPGKPSPRLRVTDNIDITNKTGGLININDAELRQYRFLGGKEFGVGGRGKFENDGGRVEVRNSYVEIAEDWTNKGAGIVYFKNSSLSIGKAYKLENNSKDTLLYTSVSIGLQGSGDFNVNGTSAIAYYEYLRVQVASSGGKFYLQGGTVNGSIDHITLKNHVTNFFSNDKLIASSSIITNGINLNSYCVLNASCYEPNGKFVGTRTSMSSSNLFPAMLMASPSSSSMNMTDAPVLVSGIDLQAGARYQYEGIAPGIDAFVTIDSLVNGAIITNLDDNVAGSGFTEGFQPQITSGAFIGASYARLKFDYFVAGTNIPAPISDLTLTALDIDGTSTYKEFDELDLGPGATYAAVLANPAIAITQLGPGRFRGINADGITVNGVDTMAKQYMFTVNNQNVSSFIVKMGIVNTQATAVPRLFSFYMKGFVYPANMTLPVKLESFTAMLMNNTDKVELRWTTSSEENLSHFVIERSSDGTNFENIAMVFANGNTTATMNYQYTDNLFGSKDKIVYYRLRSVDNDTKGKYSDTRLIRLGSKSDQSLTILTYPNPVTSELRITNPSSWQNKPVVYELFNAGGKSVNKIVTGNSSQTERMNVSNIAPGFYILRATCNGETAQQKIIKQ